MSYVLPPAPHPSEDNGFLCANCGIFMDPPRSLPCGHSVCDLCSTGQAVDAVSLMRKVYCRACRTTVPMVGFKEPPINRALEVAVCKALNVKAVVEGRIAFLEKQAAHLQTALLKAEEQLRLLVQDKAAMQRELAGWRMTKLPPPVPPRPIPPPPPRPLMPPPQPPPPGVGIAELYGQLCMLAQASNVPPPPPPPAMPRQQ